MALDVTSIVNATGKQVRAVETQVAELQNQNLNDSENLMRLQVAIGELANLRNLQSNLIRDIKDINQKIVQNA